jgi:hypothetical protein
VVGTGARRGAMVAIQRPITGAETG